MATTLIFTDDYLTELTCYANPKNICIEIKVQDHLAPVSIMLDLETSINLLNHLDSQIDLFKKYLNQ